MREISPAPLPQHPLQGHSAPPSFCMVQFPPRLLSAEPTSKPVTALLAPGTRLAPTCPELTQAGPIPHLFNSGLVLMVLGQDSGNLGSTPWSALDTLGKSLDLCDSVSPFYKEDNSPALPCLTGEYREGGHISSWMSCVA